jgi:putative hydrolase of HD superfamily
MEKSSNLEALSNIVALTHRYQQIKRATYATGEDRFENDVEHSFQLAFIGWYLIEREGLKLNKEKVLLYALCHDIVEVYAGDASFYRTDEEEKRKLVLEREGLEKLERDYADFPALAETIHIYEERKDEESKFVYALDKLIPMINIQLDNGRSWHHNKRSLQQICEAKQPKIAEDPIVHEYFILLVELLDKNPHLFPLSQ